MKKSLSRGSAALIVVVVLVVLFVLGLVVQAWRTAHPALSPQVQEQIESVRDSLWATEQNLYIAAETRDNNIVQAREHLADAVHLLNTAEEPLLGPDDTLDEDQYRVVCLYLNTMQDYLADLPDDLDDLPEEDQADIKSLLRRFCSTLRVNEEASRHPTLSSIHQSLQVFGTNYFLGELERGYPDFP